MSRINQDFMKKTITEMLETRKKRKFAETIELQVVLRDYDPEKDKRFQGSIRLPNCPYPRKKIGILGSAQHCEQAKAADIGCIDVDGMKKFNKEKKPIKKWASSFKQLVASEALMKQIPKLLGNVLNKIGKFPIVIADIEQVGNKVQEVKSTIKFQLKKSLTLGTAIATDELTEEQIRQNLNMSLNFLVSLLKKGWNNLKTVHIKTTMGKSHRIFG